MAVSTGVTIIGTTVTKRVAIKYTTGKTIDTRIGRGKFGCAQRNHGTHKTDTPILN